MTEQHQIPVLGIASGIAANETGSCMGPLVIQASKYFKEIHTPLRWHEMLYVKDTARGLNAMSAIHELNERIAEATYAFAAEQQPFLIIGGDHSSAIGAWSGAYSAIKSKGPMGMIWVDAHMDSHTPSSTHTGNIHGMPLAVLLGQGDPSLTQLCEPEAKLSPEHTCLIGIRDFEAEEEELLNTLSVRVFTMAEINERGLEAVFQDAIAIASHNAAGYGLSIDVDALDPQDAPGVSTPVQNGIIASHFLQHAHLLVKDNLLGIEISEFNPHHDQNHKTEALVCQTIDQLFKSM